MWSRSSDSGNQNNVKFGPGCSSRVYHYKPNDASVIKLKLKPDNFQNSSLFTPTVHVWAVKRLLGMISLRALRLYKNNLNDDKPLITSGEQLQKNSEL